MTPPASAHLYPCPWPFAGRAPKRELVQHRDFTRGRQWAVDESAYGQPFAFARRAHDTPWLMQAGPFADADAARQWIDAL